MTGEYRLQATREQVWQALNDPSVLRRCIPGCEALELAEADQYSAKVLAKIGPVKAKFNAKVSLTELNPPQSYTLVGEGQGGVAGFARGSASVNLVEEQAETVLHYTADFKVGGKLAQIGSRLVAGAARKIVDEFFQNFSAIVSPPSEPRSAENNAAQ